MFTSEPSLTQRIGRMIGDTPIVDAGSRIDPNQPGAADLAALMAEPRLVSQLIGVGMPADALADALPADARVLRMLPYLRRARNTAPAWCLYRIFRDLYDWDEPHLDPANYRPLFDRVAALASDPAWAPSVLLDRSKVVRILTASGVDVAPAPKLDHLIDRIAEVPPLPEEVEASADTRGRRERQVDEWLDRAATGRVRLVSIPLPSGPGDGLDLARPILHWHDRNRRPIRLADPTPKPSVVPESGSPGALSNLIDILRSFPGARFDLACGRAVPAAELASLAARSPNIIVSGPTWDDASARSIAAALAHQIQACPAAKVVGYASDAPSVEWIYGRLQFHRKAIGSALGPLIEDGFFEEDEIPPLLRQILHDTPIEAYRLDRIDAAPKTLRPG